MLKHDNIKDVRFQMQVRAGENHKRVLIATTDLEIDADHEAYDKKKVDALLAVLMQFATVEADTVHSVLLETHRE